MKFDSFRPLLLLATLVLSIATGCADETFNKSKAPKDRKGEKANPDPEADANEPNSGLQKFERSTAYPTFLEYCNSPGTEQAVMKTVEVLKGIVKENDCSLADEKLLKLDALFLQGQELLDLRPLASLPNLQKLSVRNNRVKDLTPLAELKQLQYLSISWNQVEDLSALGSLPTLRYLQMSNNPLVDAVPVTQISDLRVVWHGKGEALIERVSDKLDEETRQARERKLTWRHGDNVCLGGWFYNAYNSCRHETHGVETYQNNRSSACGVERTEKIARTCRHENNGVEKWRKEKEEKKFTIAGIRRKITKRIRVRSGISWIDRLVDEFVVDPIPDFHGKKREIIENCIDWAERFKKPNGEIHVEHKFLKRDPVRIELVCKVTIKTPELYKEAQNDACGFDEHQIFNECRHESHGVEAYKEARSSSCGLSEEITRTEPKASRSAVDNVLGTVQNCSSCDDIGTDTEEDRANKITCLKNALSVSDAGLEEEAKGVLSDLFYSKTELLTEPQVEFIQEHTTN